MMRKHHPLLRAAVLLLWTAACWRLFVPALDVPTQELRANALASMQGTLLLLLLAGTVLLVRAPRIRPNAADCCAALLLAGVTASRFLLPGPAAPARYDELLQAAMLYASLRILFTAERHAAAVLLTLLCLFGIYEAWTGIRQIYGFAYSNHGLFKVTGTLFNPGPYAGFIAPVLVCAVACIVRSNRLAGRLLRRQTLRRPRSLLRPCVLTGGLLPCLAGWGAALLGAVVLPASMSRAALAAVAAGCGALALGELDATGRLRRLFAAHPLRTGIAAGSALLLLGGAAAGAYHLKRPSAEGRLLIWKIDARILLRRPLCGAGLGNFAGAFGEEQARYFAERSRPEGEKQVAGCPEAGFNEFLQFGAETGAAGFALLLLLTGTAVAAGIRRGDPFGYGLLAAAVFASFSYPWSVLPLRLLFVVLLAGAASPPGGRRRSGPRTETVPSRRSGPFRRIAAPLLLAAGIACWPGVYGRTAARAEARRQWSDVRIWMSSGRYDYLVEDGERLLDSLPHDFRFLYDYGYALHRSGDYRRSNDILRTGARISSDPMFWNIMGKNHDALGEHSEAERAYLQAHFRIPDRIYPLYLLALHYRASGQEAEALATARRVADHTPKIESAQTRKMQEEMRGLLAAARSGPLSETQEP